MIIIIIKNMHTYNNMVMITINTAMLEMKKVFWQGTDDWDALLAERAATSGKLVLSDFTKEKLKTYK